MYHKISQTCFEITSSIYYKPSGDRFPVFVTLCPILTFLCLSDRVHLVQLSVQTRDVVHLGRLARRRIVREIKEAGEGWQRVWRSKPKWREAVS